MPERDPAAANSWLREAMAAHQAGDLEAASDAYARALRAEPRNPRALRLAGIAARELGDFERSLRLLRRAMAVAPGDPAPANELALTCLARGDLPGAAVALEAALARDGGDLRARANLGALLHHRGHLDAAAAAFRQVLEAMPDDVEIRCNLAMALAEAGQGEAALAVCDEGLARTPGHGALLAAKGAVLLALERSSEAIPVLEASLAADPGDDMALVNLAEAHGRRGEADTARAVLAHAVARNPDNARALADLVRVQVAAGESRSALEPCREFLARHPGERLVLAAYACALREAGRDDESRDLLDLERDVRIVDLPSPADFGGAAAFHRDLAAAIGADPSLVANPAGKSTRGGAQTGELDLAATPVLAAFARMIRPAIAAAIEAYGRVPGPDHPLMAPRADRHILRAWGTVLPSGGHQVPHIHPLAWFSGVYYAAVPAGMGASDAEAGWLEFGALPERQAVRVPPPRRRVEPREGRLVLFPSWFHHRTLPFVAATPRISIAFDVMPLRTGFPRPAAARPVP